ncbi:hypothetical protein Emtol_4254 [Emticicia oligotrophica DSM 17448]|uniref:LTXXQ motif family protein n=1 Tax=Emticicia oligotrophica (strain DSM 17448 / CIP 109782 / MTCC 6937 / GPTSA100-15) TaxID=929562 RepID=A0ABN4ARZ1_EMTOG|nr:Spy/CpxP family protein refolding chaperone [Emticicia oligotrophica]AFK05377.1 hypothetical protein Emtol_4254 [Emticicia oligotrophica DSM 17448]
MKKILIILLLLPFVVKSQVRQGRDEGRRFQKINSAKIGLITEKLNLTPEQAPQFWAIYNEYDNKKIELRKNIRRSMEDAVSLATTDDKIIAAQKQIIALRRREIDLEEEYMSKILKTITPRQFSELKRTEMNFNKMLIEKLNDKADN